ncbi:hypothetical protein HC928_24370, partial [bacterium]|nr:hypothetical protein [bacterium]
RLSWENVFLTELLPHIEANFRVMTSARAGHRRHLSRRILGIPHRAAPAGSVQRRGRAQRFF